MLTKLTFALVAAVLCLGISSQAHASEDSTSQLRLMALALDDASDNPIYSGGGDNPLFAVAQKR